MITIILIVLYMLTGLIIPFLYQEADLQDKIIFGIILSIAWLPLYGAKKLKNIIFLGKAGE